jgi:uncharacterized protein YdcH (DUF465 family)
MKNKENNNKIYKGNYECMIKVVEKYNTMNALYYNTVMGGYTFSNLLYSKIKKIDIKLKDNSEYPSKSFIYQNIEKIDDKIYVEGLMKMTTS